MGAGASTVFDEPKGDARLLTRIAVDADVCAGKPRVRGTRIWVGLVLGMLAHGTSIEAVLEEYPQLRAADISACLAYGAMLAKSTVGRIRRSTACGMMHHSRGILDA